jgi:retron-type reverse transcriptase
MMYGSLCRRGGSSWPADAHVRQVRVEAHVGTVQDFLRRHERESSKAARSSYEARRKYSSQLLKRTADTRNLHVALDHIIREGGNAAGPDGLRPHDPPSEARLSRLSITSTLILNGTYQPTKGRTVRIQKASCNCHRTITVASLGDRIVQRGIVQILQPYLVSRFVDNSFGYRPGRGREHAPGRSPGATISGLGSRRTRRAPYVPIQPQMEVLRKHIPAREAPDLIKTPAA